MQVGQGRDFPSISGTGKAPVRRLTKAKMSPYAVERALLGLATRLKQQVL